jgi:sugar lactone lactonase YvrE
VSKVSTLDGSVTPFVSGLSYPEGIAMDRSGNFYVAQEMAGVIEKITPAGAMSQFIGNLGYYYLSGMAFDSFGNLYVGANHYEGTFVAAILKFNAQGSLLSTWSWPGDTTTPLQPTGLTFDSAGNLIVTDYSGNNLWSINPAGFATRITPLYVNPFGLVFDRSGNLFVSTSASGNITEMAPGGAVSTFASGLSNPAGLALDGAGNLYVGSMYGSGLTQIAPDGTSRPFSAGLNRPEYMVVVPEPGSFGLITLGISWLILRSRLPPAQNPRGGPNYR